MSPAEKFRLEPESAGEPQKGLGRERHGWLSVLGRFSFGSKAEGWWEVGRWVQG